MQKVDSEVWILANRLPISLEGGAPHLAPGGLVSAVLPVASSIPNLVWLGWSGVAGRHAQVPRNAYGFRLERLTLSAQEIEGYYLGMANSVLWPLAHGRPDLAAFDADDWSTYRKVNAKFAQRVADLAGHAATVWVHDYHLQLVPGMLRELRDDLKIGFFLHTPAIRAESFASLQDSAGQQIAKELAEGLANADLLGVQSARDARDLKDATGLDAQVFPISIDPALYLPRDPSEGLPEPSTQQTTTQLPNLPIVGVTRSDGPVFLGVDRLDYSKGILQRLNAFRQLLTEMSGSSKRGSSTSNHSNSKPTLWQVLTPTRESVPAYRDLRVEVDRLSAEINAEFGDESYAPVQNFFVNLGRNDLVKFYRSADVLLVSSVRDGMNLVAKEFVASRTDEQGVLVLSEFAGSSEELDLGGKGALLFDPLTEDDFLRVLRLACRLCSEEGESAPSELVPSKLVPSERVRRMRLMREQVMAYTAETWANSFLQTLWSS